MTTKKGLIEIYTSMVEDGEGDLLYAEISECKRLKELYQERLRCLIERDPKLALVREGAVHMYTLYETHFRKKIHENEQCFEAASEVLEKWRSPPKRPRHTLLHIPTTEGNNFYMDFENACLSQNWNNRKRAHPKGPKRYEDPEWAEMIKSQVYPHHSDIDWHEYVEWVKNGGGDEWFQESDE